MIPPLRVARFASLILIASRAGAAEIHIVENPAPGVVHEIALQPSVQVRWAERGLLVCVVEASDQWRQSWGGRTLGQLASGDEIAILRPADELDPATHAKPVRDYLAQRRRALVTAAAGPVAILVAPAGTWPDELRGCHGGLAVAAARIDPRAILDAPAPRALATWLAPRAFDARELERIAAVSPDSIAAELARLTQDSGGGIANRYVFGLRGTGARPDLETLYGPRILNTMQRALAGIPGAVVERQRFPMLRRSTPAENDSSFNFVARLPGSVPGTGTFVVCAHVDATGSRNMVWRTDAEGALTTALQTPGAEDNASGVACVLELLRQTAAAVRAGDADFAFDLEFIAFSGEEVAGAEGGLVGSQRYVEKEVARGTNLLGAFNLDMVGYDSLSTNLQLVHNPASRWLTDLFRQAAAAVMPPIGITLVPELDEARASDHNSFWNVNASAQLAADAPVNVLRSYATYHRPIDTGDRVSIPKLTAVTQAHLAALLRFNTRAHTAPRLLMTNDDLSLKLRVQGTDVEYDPTFHRVWPGSLLSVQLFVHSLGATFADTLGLAVSVRNGAQVRTVLSRREFRTLPTGARVALFDPVPILASDGGAQTLEARISYRDSTGAAVEQVATTAFRVEVQNGLGLTLQPNPVQGGLAAASIAYELNRPGVVVLEVFNLEGERVYASSQRLEPLITSAVRRLPLTQGGPPAPELASGAYIVRARWTGDDGGQAEAKATLVLKR
jgi:hypothetical protein